MLGGLDWRSSWALCGLGGLGRSGLERSTWALGSICCTPERSNIIIIINLLCGGYGNRITCIRKGFVSWLPVVGPGGRRWCHELRTFRLLAVTRSFGKWDLRKFNLRRIVLYKSQGVPINPVVVAPMIVVIRDTTVLAVSSPLLVSSARGSPADRPEPLPLDRAARTAANLALTSCHSKPPHNPAL